MNIQDIITGLDYLSNTANKSTVMIKNMLVIIFILVVCFIIRYIILLRINRIDLRKLSPEQKRQNTILQNHLGYEFALAILISWLLMIIFGSTQVNFVINLIISPIFGLLSGITLDNIYILPRQNRSLYNIQANSSNKKTNQKSDNPITININNEKDSLNDSKNSKLNEKHLSDDIANTEEFDNEVIKAINNLKDVQSSQIELIKQVSEQCQSTLDVINNLKKSEMMDKKIALKTKIYDCLSKGFVTPKEHDQIRLEYLTYTNLLDGNGDIEELYNNYYSKLNIHEERRKENKEVKLDRRKQKDLCQYGQYDKNI